MSRRRRLAPGLAAFAALAAFALSAAGCVGEAGVSFQGSVVEGPATGYAFEPSPAAGTPVAGATVDLCFYSCSPQGVTADDGSYPLMEAVFGGFIGSETHIAVRITAPDGRTAEYATIFEESDDPLTANPSCEGCEPVFLNFTLAPL